MASLKRDKWGNYILRFRVGGRGTPEVRENLGPITFDDAKAKAREIEERQRRAGPALVPGITVAQLADKYFETEGDRLTERGRALASIIVDKHLKPALGAIKTVNLTALDVKLYRKNRRRLKGRKKGQPVATETPVSPSTLNREWSVLRAILNWGEANGVIGRNPIPRRAIRQMETSPSNVYFEPGEWREFVETARVLTDGAQFVPLLRTLLLTGSRIGEMAELRWRDVDLERRVLLVRQLKVHGKPKALFMPEPLAEILKALPRGIGEAPVFTRAKGEPWEVAGIQVAFRRVEKIVGLGEHGKLTPHKVRHTAATWLRRAGVSIDQIADVLGQQSRAVRVTMDYAHLTPETTRTAMLKLAELEAIANGAEVVRNRDEKRASS